MRRPLFFLAAALLAEFSLTVQAPAQADTFGSGANAFTIDFVAIGNTNNEADVTGYGKVPYKYRIGKFEISEDTVTRAIANGLTNVRAGSVWRTANQARTSISWYEAAAFVNWLNLSTGKQPAYNLTWDGSAWNMKLWSRAESWQLGGENLFRHKDAHYFLPSDDEWYKAAYGKADGIGYFVYPTGGNQTPTPVEGGTAPGTAVYEQILLAGPASVESAGGLSAYGTMGQGGNALEWNETTFDGTNSSAIQLRSIRGGAWLSGLGLLVSSALPLGNEPSYYDGGTGFRVASIVPAPITNVILTIEKATTMSGPWQFEREINVGPMTNTNEFYRLKIRTVVE